MKKTTILDIILFVLICIPPIVLSSDNVGQINTVSITKYWGSSRAYIFKNGRILLVRGKKDEYWDPKKQHWVGTSKSTAKETGIPDDVSDNFLSSDARHNQKVFVSYSNWTYPARIMLWDSLTARWYIGPKLIISRKSPAATRLADGSLMITGGGITQRTNYVRSVLGNDEPSADVEIFDGKKIKKAVSMNVARMLHHATLLNNGNVMVTGGVIRRKESLVIDRRIIPEKAIASVEQYNTALNKWEELPPLKEGRYGHSAIKLKDGRVIVIGGYEREYHSLDSVEIWNPATNTWEQGPPLPNRLQSPHSVLLSDGNVLVSGGIVDARSVYMLDTTTMQWHPIDIQGHKISPTTMIALKDKGALLFARNRTVLHWSPTTTSVNSKISNGYIPRKVPALVTLKDNRLLVAGGGTLNVQIWNPLVEFWDEGGSLNNLMEKIRGMELPDGRVMLVGVDRYNKPLCEIGSPSTKTWGNCPDFPKLPEITHRWDGQPTIKMLSDKYAIVMFDPEKALLWDIKKEAWHIVKVNDEHKKLRAGRYSIGDDKIVGQLRVTEGPNHYALLGKTGEILADVSVSAAPTTMGRNAAIRLKDGRSFFVFRKRGSGGTGSALFNGKNKWYRYNGDYLGIILGDTLLETKDGCILSWSTANYGTPPVTIIDGDTLTPIPVNTPMSVRDGAAVMHKDGTTVTFAGRDRMSETGAGGIRQFRASCKGLVPLHKTVSMMPSLGQSVTSDEPVTESKRSVSLKGFFNFSFTTVLILVLLLLVAGIFIYIIRLARR